MGLSDANGRLLLLRQHGSHGDVLRVFASWITLDNPKIELKWTEHMIYIYTYICYMYVYVICIFNILSAAMVSLKVLFLASPTIAASL